MSPSGDFWSTGWPIGWPYASTPVICPPMGPDPDTAEPCPRGNGEDSWAHGFDVVPGEYGAAPTRLFCSRCGEVRVI